MVRKGMGKGMGKGYKNIQGRDPKIHSDSSKGIKQPQRLHEGMLVRDGREVGKISRVGEANVQVVWERGKAGQLLAKGRIESLPKSFFTVKGETQHLDRDKDGVDDSLDCDPDNKYKQVLEKVFPVKKGVQIDAHWEKTRSGFRHIAILKVGGYEHKRAKVTYLNRTWESFEFETVLRKLLDSSEILTTKEKEKFMEDAKTGNLREIEERFGAISSIANLGNVMADTKEEKNKWKKRMLKAGVPELDFPEDWDSLNENEKEKMLDLIIKQMNKKIR